MTKRKEKNKGNPLQRQNPKVDEVTRIRISQILQHFQASKDEVYKFEAGLSNEERALVHQLAQKMGFKSKSSGLGKDRRVAVHKIKKKVETNNGFGNLPHFTFSQEASQVLGNLFAHYPPGDGSFGETIGENSDSTDKLKQKKDDIFARPSMSKAEIAKKMEALTSRMMSASNLKQITEDRSKLPIASFKDTIVSTVESNQVVLISGETGCGKTTQVPQFILDHMWSKGAVCKIVCTQPRRISATSVSDRIASERGEAIGESVGYKIRLESKGGRNSSIVLCTTGVLLRVLVSKGSSSKTGPMKDDISGITHIIMDEIHERDRYSDFMLAIIRDMLPSYPRLRLILMSATIDAARFSQYFGGCPVINVPGFTYPVKTFYLEDVLSIVKSKDGGNHLENDTTSVTPINNCELSEEEKVSIDEAINLAWFSDEWDMLSELVSSKGSLKLFNYQHSSTGLTPLMVFAGKGRVGDMCMLLSLGVDFYLKSHDGNTALEIAERENQQEAAGILKKHMDNNFSNSMEEKQLLDKYLATVNPELVDEVLIEQLIRKICVDSEEGGILVFLPGWDDINRTRERLLASSFFKNPSKFMVIALHSMVPSMEQKKREGRAGRCQPGICYHLYSNIRAASLPDFQIPEIRRISIEELCLQVKLLDPTCKIEEFLRKTLDPPVFESIRNAILVLQDIGALSTDEKLTQLGEKLGSLPVHPLTSRMLFFAILMDCLNPALTLACASDYRDPFTIPMLSEEKKRASAAKAELASLYGGSGDQFAVVAAFECWSNAKNMGLEARFCSQYFVSSSAMHMLSGMRRQLQTELVRSGFIPEDATSYSMNAHDPGVLHAVLVAGLYPMVGRFLPNKKGKRVMIETAGGDKVRLHTHSTNFKLSFKKNLENTLIVYDEITRGDMGMSIRNCTVVGPLPLLLLSTEIAVAPAQDNENGDGSDDDDDNDDDEESEDEDEDEVEDEVKAEDAMELDNKSSGDTEAKIMSSPDNMVKVIMDRWLYFGSTAMDVAQLYCLRERLSAAILYKVTHPRNSLPPMLGASMHAIACILSCDGCSGLPVTSDGVDTLTTMVNTTYLGKPAPGGSRRMGKKQKGSFTEHINSEGRQISGPSRGSISAS
ncbi:hypothetical protein PIB30_042981 [Stylosanthes scabra]|uniref:RNA helicase n=1 Tax=Stylosanthes scabra TaxID=79078 RepID=A0ABU6SG46_9FABA|nr:hypothetical protein [Stylosanthes scabra]